jgi:putative membrane protein
MNTFIQSLKEFKLLLICTLAYLIPFTVAFVSKGNGEFIWYALIVVGLFLLVIGTLPTSRFPKGVLWALSAWALLHMAGGGVKVGAGVLYGLQLLPIYNGGGEMIILKYDQVVHAFGFGICAYIVFHFLKRYCAEPHRFGVYAIAALGGVGMGVLNEIAEFIAVILFPNNGVGGYVNTSLDLVFNTLGAVIVMSAVAIVHKRKG